MSDGNDDVLARYPTIASINVPAAIALAVLFGLGFVALLAAVFSSIRVPGRRKGVNEMAAAPHVQLAANWCGASRMPIFVLRAVMAAHPSFGLVTASALMFGGGTVALAAQVVELHKVLFLAGIRAQVPLARPSAKVVTEVERVKAVNGLFFLLVIPVLLAIPMTIAGPLLFIGADKSESSVRAGLALRWTTEAALLGVILALLLVAVSARRGLAQALLEPPGEEAVLVPTGDAAKQSASTSPPAKLGAQRVVSDGLHRLLLPMDILLVFRLVCSLALTPPDVFFGLYEHEWTWYVFVITPELAILALLLYAPGLAYLRLDLPPPPSFRKQSEAAAGSSNGREEAPDVQTDGAAA